MNSLKIYNSLTQKKEDFVPLIPHKVSLYFCGPTVYNDPHVGNFRPVVTFDILRRVLLALGYEVTAVSNYTDVDDKIIRRAAELHISEKELTDSIIKEYRHLVDEVGAMQPTYTPRPTEYMNDIIQYVDDLVQKGYAYVVDGDVYLRVRMIPEYGELSGNSIEELESGARISPLEKKEDPLDFALWKKTEVGIRWDSPWGKGRPGWHTECCVMIAKIFAEQNGYIDIHGGGFDLKFPHHENEMAQAKAHNGNKLARYWMHNGFIDIRGEKMSKSLGNVILMKDVIRDYGGMPFRLMLLSAHYRAPATFADETMKEASKKYAQIENAVRKTAITLQRQDISLDFTLSSPSESVLEALLDDLNTPNALASLYEELKSLNQTLAGRTSLSLKDVFSHFLSDLNLLGIKVEIPLLSEEDKTLYRLYDKARADKDFAESDRIRKILSDKNIF